jgi:hypothetical protein
MKIEKTESSFKFEYHYQPSGLFLLFVCLGTMTAYNLAGLAGALLFGLLIVSFVTYLSFRKGR